MVKPTRASPGVGHNSGELPDQATYRMGLALYVLMQEETKRMKERHKRLTKRQIEGKSMAVEDIKLMFAKKDDSLTDIVHFIKRKMHSLGAMLGVKFQLDFFAPDPETSEAIRFKAMLAGCAGDPCQPPATLNPEERNLYIEGHSWGADARKSAQKEMADEFTKGEDGDFSEPALTSRAKGKAKAKAVGLQAAADFAADNPGAPTPEEQQLDIVDAANAAAETPPFTEATAAELEQQKPRLSQSEKAAAKREAAKVDA